MPAVKCDRQIVTHQRYGVHGHSPPSLHCGVCKGGGMYPGCRGALVWGANVISSMSRPANRSVADGDSRTMDSSVANLALFPRHWASFDA